MLRNPGGRLTDCANELNKSLSTISLIAGSDMFREYLARRKEEWRQEHDFALREKVTAVAEASLDLVLAKIQTKGDMIPMTTISAVSTSALDRLGYGPRAQPQVQVNVQNNDNRQVQVPVTAAALEEARAALRLAEARRIRAPDQIAYLEPEAHSNGERIGPMEGTELEPELPLPNDVVPVEAGQSGGRNDPDDLPS